MLARSRREWLESVELTRLSVQERVVAREARRHDPLLPEDQLPQPPGDHADRNRRDVPEHCGGRGRPVFVVSDPVRTGSRLEVRLTAVVERAERPLDRPCGLPVRLVS